MRNVAAVAVVVSLYGCRASAIEFPGPAPGPASVRADPQSRTYSLSSNVIAVTWRLRDGRLLLDSIKDKLRGKIYRQDGAPLFALGLHGAKDRLTDWRVKEGPRMQRLRGVQTSARAGRSFDGQSLVVVLEPSTEGIAVTWKGELRDGANYVRTTIDITADAGSPVVGYVGPVIDVRAPGAVAVGKNRSGTPVRVDDVFLGVEVPFFGRDLRNGRTTLGFGCKLPLRTDVSHPFSAVIGVAADGQFRRSLLHYVERERARAYKPFLHYNCWFDLCSNVSEKGMLDRINTIHRELGEKRGVKVVSYVVDDGYDDYNRGFWVFDLKKFPNGFTPLARRLSEINSNLGLWLSPAAGYGGRSKQRRQRAREIGIPSLDLSTSAYYEWFLDRHRRFMREEQVNYFKWDKLGGGVSGHFMALMRIADRLRQIDPDVFLNTTVGTWQSPFWLMHVDCTWRGGQDVGFMGKGCEREKWLTYRDGVSWKVVANSEFAYPLNALMNHGIVNANGHKFGSRILRGSLDLRNEARSYFGGGYGLQELYVTPDVMADDQWDAIAEAARWAKRNADVLVDSHFIGGDPNLLEVYGFAAWQKNRGTITLRNPDEQPKTFSLDVGTAFELPKGAARRYSLTSPYRDQRIGRLTAAAGDPVDVRLEPFEVLVFDAVGR